MSKRRRIQEEFINYVIYGRIIANLFYVMFLDRKNLLVRPLRASSAQAGRGLCVSISQGGFASEKTPPSTDGGAENGEN